MIWGWASGKDRHSNRLDSKAIVAIRSGWQRYRSSYRCHIAACHDEKNASVVCHCRLGDPGPGRTAVRDRRPRADADRAFRIVSLHQRHAGGGRLLGRRGRHRSELRRLCRYAGDNQPAARVRDARGGGDGKNARQFFPVWAQKSFGACTTFGGGGYPALNWTARSCGP